MKKYIDRFILIAVIIGLLSMYYYKNQDYVEQVDLLEASNDTIKKWKDSNGKAFAKIRVLETREVETFLKLESKEKTINDLKNLVKQNKKKLKNQGSASIIKSETKIDTVTKTIVVKDTITNKPIYKSFVKDKWYEINTVSKFDSTYHKIKTFSNLSLVIGFEKQGWFKKPLPYAVANDENPNTDIKDMRVYQVTLPPKKWFSVAPSINYGVDLLGRQYITGGVSIQLEKLSIKF